MISARIFGQIKTADKTIAQRYVNDFAFNFLNYTLISADLNGDGQVDETDIDLYTKYMSTKEITTFPAGAPLEEKTTTKEIIDVNPDTFLIENSLEKGKTHEYEIIMWISNAATNNDLYVNRDTTKPIEYKYALNIEASDEEIKEDGYALSFAKANVGQNGLEQITHEIDDTLQVDSKFATEYRYRGGDSTVNNYVTFNNETWRIIGIIPTEDTSGNVENRLKIIKDESVGKMKWNKRKDTTTNTYNNWVTAALNTYLNNDYYNTLSSDAQNMIGTTKYYLGGYSDNPNITTDVMWQYERKKINGSDCNSTDDYQSGTECYYHGTNPIMQNDVNKKIAIMYASDYGYAASKACTSNLYEYNGSANCITTNNWLDKSTDTWLLSQDSANSYYAFNVLPSGYVNSSNIASGIMYAVRPVLYLSSNIKISGGEGTSQKPYMLSIS